MHEGAIAEALVEQVRRFLPEEGNLVSARVAVGGLEHVEPGVLRTWWDALLQETSLAGAELEIRLVPLRVRCDACEEEHEPEDQAVLACLACGAVRPQVIAGSGVVLESLEVEEP